MHGKFRQGLSFFHFLILGIMETVPMLVAYIISWQSYENLLKMEEDEEKEEA